MCKQMKYFNKEVIKIFAQQQRKRTDNPWPSLAPAAHGCSYEFRQIKTDGKQTS